MSDFSRLLWRGPRLGLALAVSFTAVLALLFLFHAHASAVLTASGAGNCGDFAPAISLAKDKGTILQMTPAKDTNGAIITRNLRISGGWFPLVQCDDNNQKFTSTQAFITHGFAYSAATELSELNGFDFPVLQFDLSEKRVVLENLDLNGDRAGISSTLANSELVMYNTLVREGWADNNGGATYMHLSDNSLWHIADSWFRNNQADNSGGGLYATLDSSKIVLERVTVEDSVAHADGGGGLNLYVNNDSELMVRDSQFINNRTQLINQDGGGGRIYLDGGRVHIINTRFAQNDAGRNGGGLYIEILENGGEIILHNVHFENNQADNAGSGLYVVHTGSSPASLTLINTTFTNNGSANQLQISQAGSGLLTTKILDEQIFLPLTANSYIPSERVDITGITLNTDFEYVVEFEANFAPQLPGVHLHFFFDTVPPSQAGMPGSGPWMIYGSSSPFTGYSFFDRPYGSHGAEKMCVLVANPDHSVRLNTGNCYKLP